MAKIKANDPSRPGEPKASELMKLSGHHIVYARKIYILESNLLALAKKLEVTE